MSQQLAALIKHLVALRTGVLLPDAVALLLVLVVDPLFVKHLVAVVAGDGLLHVVAMMLFQEQLAGESFAAH